ncbi:MAG: hypothetical protein JXB04_07140 [Kiritimatiellae bacterium]|nr:hypothetical protein [Kiritimatiellia bacterium]
MKKSLLVSVVGVLAATPVIIWAQCASMPAMKGSGPQGGCGPACVSKPAGPAVNDAAVN